MPSPFGPSWTPPSSSSQSTSDDFLHPWPRSSSSAVPSTTTTSVPTTNSRRHLHNVWGNRRHCDGETVRSDEEHAGCSSSDLMGKDLAALPAMVHPASHHHHKPRHQDPNPRHARILSRLSILKPWISIIMAMMLIAALATTVVASSSSTSLMTSRAMLTSKHQSTAPAGCKISEFSCSNGKCVSADRYCDGDNDCGDKSDEPRYCSPCNRTYYGDTSSTYSLDIIRPRSDKLPFICRIDLVAGGREYGDVVKIVFDQFTVGTLVPGSTTGCSGAYVQISEPNRPDGGGRWCGSGAGSYSAYYSEGPSVSLTLRVLNLTHDGLGQNFDFQIRYKFLKSDAMLTRNGPLDNQKYRGVAVKNTVCDRTFDSCDVKRCVIQSPNYPGLYPRNVTCRYVIKQSRVPPDKLVRVVIRQENPHLIHVADSEEEYSGAGGRRLGFWRDCSKDSIKIFDGTASGSPLLVKICSGDRMPPVTSSKNELLVLFSAAPYDHPSHPTPLRHVMGFEFDVDVKFIDKDVNAKRKPNTCNVVITSGPTNRAGIVKSPSRSLPPNTNCTFLFKGAPKEIVWIYFITYEEVQLYPDDYSHKNRCMGDVTQLIDGKVNDPSAPIIGTFCNAHKPTICDHAARNPLETPSRSCALKESYTSSKNALTLRQYYSRGSAISGVNFTLKYEFVDMSVSDPCVALITSSSSWAPTSAPFTTTTALNASAVTSVTGSAGTIATPRNAFLYGRGGRDTLTCLFQFRTSGPDERVRVEISSLFFNERQCDAFSDRLTDRYTCVPPGGNPAGNTVANVVVNEYPWDGIKMQRYCFCDARYLPVVYESFSPLLELNFTIQGMKPDEDFENYYLKASYEFQRRPPCPEETRIMNGTHGRLVFGDTSPALSGCADKPWLLKAEPESYVYLKVHGQLADDDSCVVKSRVTVTAPGRTVPLKVICPAAGGHQYVEVFSRGWFPSGEEEKYSPGYLKDPEEDLSNPSKDLIVTYVGHQLGIYTASWMEITRPANYQNFFDLSTADLTQVDDSKDGASEAPLTNGGLASRDPVIVCEHYCPELKACISPDLWCDGIVHCPITGKDESRAACWSMPLLWLLSGVGVAFLVVLTCVTFGLMIHRLKGKKRAAREQASAAVPVNSNTNAIPDGGSSLLGGSNTMTVGLGMPPVATMMRANSVHGTIRRGGSLRNPLQAAGNTLDDHAIGPPPAAYPVHSAYATLPHKFHQSQQFLLQQQQAEALMKPTTMIDGFIPGYSTIDRLEKVPLRAAL